MHFPLKSLHFLSITNPENFSWKFYSFFYRKKIHSLYTHYFFSTKKEDKTKINCTGKKWGSLISTVFLWYSLFYFALASKYALFRAFRVNCIVIFICFYPKNSFTFYAFIIDTFLCVCVFFVRFVYRKRGKSTDFFRFFVFFQCKKNEYSQEEENTEWNTKEGRRSFGCLGIWVMVLNSLVHIRGWMPVPNVHICRRIHSKYTEHSQNEMQESNECPSYANRMTMTKMIAGT